MNACVPAFIYIGDAIVPIEREREGYAFIPVLLLSGLL